MNIVSATATLPMDAEMLSALTLVGQPVTWNGGQYTVHAIEGDNWYAFNQDGQVTVDTNMTARFLSSPALATLIPEGAKLGDGVSETAPMTHLTKGWAEVAEPIDVDAVEPTKGQLLMIELGY